MGDHDRWETRYQRGDAPLAREPSPVVREFVNVLPDGRALDVATGAGRDALFLAARGYTVDAFDISETALAVARERAQERDLTVNWIQADAATRPFPERCYDVITVSRFDAREQLAALQRALVPGGVLVYDGFLRGGDNGPPDRYRFAPGELRTACADLELLHYDEGDGRVELVARRPE